MHGPAAQSLTDQRLAHGRGCSAGSMAPGLDMATLRACAASEKRSMARAARAPESYRGGANCAAQSGDISWLKVGHFFCQSGPAGMSEGSMASAT